MTGDCERRWAALPRSSQPPLDRVVSHFRKWEVGFYGFCWCEQFWVFSSCQSSPELKDGLVMTVRRTIMPTQWRGIFGFRASVRQLVFSVTEEFLLLACRRISSRDSFFLFSLGEW